VMHQLVGEVLAELEFDAAERRHPDKGKSEAAVGTFSIYRCHSRKWVL
jgi:hypothetical protein